MAAGFAGGDLGANFAWECDAERGVGTAEALGGDFGGEVDGRALGAGVGGAVDGAGDPTALAPRLAPLLIEGLGLGRCAYGNRAGSEQAPAQKVTSRLLHWELLGLGVKKCLELGVGFVA